MVQIVPVLQGGGDWRKLCHCADVPFGRAFYSAAFLFVAVVCLILLFLFNPRNIIRQDDKLREAAGLPLDRKLAAKFDEEKKRQ